MNVRRRWPLTQVQKVITLSTCCALNHFYAMDGIKLNFYSGNLLPTYLIFEATASGRRSLSTLNGRRDDRETVTEGGECLTKCLLGQPIARVFGLKLTARRREES